MSDREKLVEADLAGDELQKASLDSDGEELDSDGERVLPLVELLPKGMAVILAVQLTGVIFAFIRYRFLFFNWLLDFGFLILLALWSIKKLGRQGLLAVGCGAISILGINNVIESFYLMGSGVVSIKSSEELEKNRGAKLFKVQGGLSFERCGKKIYFSKILPVVRRYSNKTAYIFCSCRGKEGKYWLSREKHEVGVVSSEQISSFYYCDYTPGKSYQYAIAAAPYQSHPFKLAAQKVNKSSTNWPFLRGFETREDFQRELDSIHYYGHFFGFAPYIIWLFLAPLLRVISRFFAGYTPPEEF